MRNLLFFLFLLLFTNFLFAQNVWINEFHYDNVSNDAGEFIEVALENAGAYTLSDFTVSLYNGNTTSRKVYNTKNLGEYTAGTNINNVTLYYFDYPFNGIENGSPDGICLDYQGTVILYYKLRRYIHCGWWTGDWPDICWYWRLSKFIYSSWKFNRLNKCRQSI